MSDLKNQSRRVAIFANRGRSVFEFGVAIEVFSKQRPPGHAWYTPYVFSLEPGPLESADGFHFVVDNGVNSLKSADVIVVPGWADRSKSPPTEMLDELVAAYHRGAELISFCTGSFVIAATGLLDGRRATTHWMYAEEFKQSYPSVELVDDVLFVNEDRIATSAGSAAAIDLTLHLVRRDYGVVVANEVAKRLVIAPARSGSQKQYAERPVEDETNCISQTMEWTRRNLGREDLTVNHMAAVANLTRRSFDRNFRQVTGTSPNQWSAEAHVMAGVTLAQVWAMPESAPQPDGGPCGGSRDLEPL